MSNKYHLNKSTLAEIKNVLSPHYNGQEVNVDLAVKIIEGFLEEYWASEIAPESGVLDDNMQDVYEAWLQNNFLN